MKLKTISVEQSAPDQVELLLAAEAPPRVSDRYLYFADVKSHDSLFRYVTMELLNAEPTRNYLGSLEKAACVPDRCLP